MSADLSPSILLLYPKSQEGSSSDPAKCHFKLTAASCIVHGVKGKRGAPEKDLGTCFHIHPGAVHFPGGSDPHAGVSIPSLERVGAQLRSKAASDPRPLAQSPARPGRYSAPCLSNSRTCKSRALGGRGLEDLLSCSSGSGTPPSAIFRRPAAPAVNALPATSGVVA